MSKPTDEWGTPLWLFEILDEEFKFKLDVCASKKNYKCAQYLDKESNALDWHISWLKSNWCNPPYSDQLPWVEKAWEQVVHHGYTTVMLMKYDPSTKHGKMARLFADEIRIIEHRIKFEGASSSANFPSAIVIFRPRLNFSKSNANIVYVDYRGFIK